MSNRKIIIFFLLIFSSIPCFSATFVVTSNADSGPGTLRDAINQATANSGGTIDFNLPVTVAGRTITLLSALPSLPSNLFIDGGSQAGVNFGVSSARVALFYQVPVEQLFAGLSIINQSNVVVKGLYINNTTFVGNATMQYFWRGVKIEGGNNISIINSDITGFYFPISDNWESGLVTNGLTLQQDILGVDIDGQTLPANSELFTVLENLDGNIILGAQGIGNYFATGLSISGNNTVSATHSANVSITNNYIGVNYLINTVSESFGLSIENITTVNPIYVQNNIIDNLLGVASIYLNGLSQTISLTGNYIGVDKTLTKNLPTSHRGIYVDGCPNGQVLIGDGTAANSNYITGCKPVEINNGSHVAVSRNSFFCTVNEYPMYDYTDPHIPSAGILTTNSTMVAGTATPNSTVELFYSDKCNTCSPETYFATLKSTANGQWSFSGSLTGSVIASATLNGYTSEFTTVKIDSSKVTVTNACNNNDSGTITGMIPYSATSVQWVDKNGTSAGNTANLTAPPGVYKLIVRNGSCQTSSAYYQIKTHFNTDITHLVSSNSTCGNNNGTLTGITIKNNDASQIIFAWKDMNGKTWGSAADLTNVPAGSYSLSVSTSDQSCTDILGPFSVKNTGGIIISETGAQAQETPCNKSTGAITGIQITGGTGTYSYIWWNAEQQTVGTQQDLTGQPAGTYKLQVTDGSQCGPVYSSFIQIPEINGITLDETGAVSNPATCEMSNGSITGIKVTGATTYTWADATGKTYITPTPNLTKSAAGNYTLTASSINGCIITSKTYTITQPAPTQFSGYTVTQVEPCFGQSNGMLTVNIDALVKSERWVTPQNISLSGTSINNLAAGSYQLYLTDQNDCENLYTTITLTTIPQLVIADKGNVMNSQCGLSNANISGLTLTGGLPPYFYRWTDENSNQVGTDSNTIANVPGGTYTVLVTDRSCGLVTATYIVLNNTVDIPVPSVSGTQQLCSSGTALINVNSPDPTTIYRIYDSPTGTTPVQEVTGGQFRITVNTTSTFYITQVNGSCESTRAEVKVTVGLSVLNIANTFTPNGDGHNDYWQINNIENYPAAFVQVFNRYGQKVYESKGYSKPFDGNYNGKALPSGAYYYIINLSSTCSLLAGSLNIIR